MLACSAIGSYIGLIPGLGGGPAQWVAYAHAVQSSPGDKDRFGKGAIEGVLGPARPTTPRKAARWSPPSRSGCRAASPWPSCWGPSSSRASCRGPTCSIPPSTWTSRSRSSGSSSSPTSSPWPSACLFLNQLARITFVKGTFLIPFLLLLIYLGGFAVNNAFGDILMVLIFGAVGWLMVRFDWQRPPLLLGLVLGGIAENTSSSHQGLRRRIRAAAGVLFIALLIVAGLFYPVFQDWREKKRLERHEARFEVPGVTKTEEAISRNERVACGVFALCFVALFAYVLRECFWGFGAYEERAALFPLIIGLPAFAISIAVFVKEIATTSKVVVHGEEGVEEAEEISPRRPAAGPWPSAPGWWVSLSPSG